MVALTCTLVYPLGYRYPACGGAGNPVEVPSVLDLINVETLADVVGARAAMTNYVWGVAGYPAGGPDVVTLGVAAPWAAGLPNWSSVDLYQFNLPFGVTQYAWRFHATASNGRVAIYHGGHAQAVDNVYTLMPVGWLLAAGYDVVAMVMPFAGSNTDGSYDGNPFNLSHYQLVNAEVDRDVIGYSTMRLFAEPVAEVLNLLAGEGYSRVAMMGVSGGGWTTTLMAALDPRITHSYPTAGIVPWFLIPDAALPGMDTEQYLGALLDCANYEDQYVMAAVGSGRRQMQILNVADPSPLNADLDAYRAAIRQRVAEIGRGSWDGRMDASGAIHQLSPAAMATILLDMA